MNGLLVIKICGIGLLTAIFNIVLDKINKEVETVSKNIVNHI